MSESYINKITKWGDVLELHKDKIKDTKYPDESVYTVVKDYKYIKETVKKIRVIEYYLDQLNLNKESEIDKLKQEIKHLIQEIDNNIKDLTTRDDIAEFNNVKEKYNSQTDIDILKEYIKTLKEIISKILENKGKVRTFIRTFIRLKETHEKKIGYTINDEKTKITTECDGKQTFGPFKHIYDSISNEDLLKDDEVKDIINLLEQGISTLLFSYGISGSGKSYTLFGNDKTDGVVQYIIKTLKSKGFKINIDSIKEEYVDTFVVTGENLDKNNPLSALSGNINEEMNIKEEMNINKLVKDITKKRIKNKRIKETPNNKESSRSHLYITFKISKDGTVSYFTVIDCAGRETPKEIFDSYFSFEKTGNYPGTFYLYDIKNLNEKNTYVSKLKTVTGTKDEIKKYVSDNKSKLTVQLQYIKDLIKEGFYINESLNHLIYFINKQADNEYKFNTKTSLQTNITDKYDPSKYFYNPSESKSNSIQTIKILEEIFKKKGSSGINPKIIMFTNIRLEQTRCIDTNKSLEFAQQVKSTV